PSETHSIRPAWLTTGWELPVTARTSRFPGTRIPCLGKITVALRSTYWLRTPPWRTSIPEFTGNRRSDEADVVIDRKPRQFSSNCQGKTLWSTPQPPHPRPFPLEGEGRIGRRMVRVA